MEIKKLLREIKMSKYSHLRLSIKSMLLILVLCPTSTNDNGLERDPQAKKVPLQSNYYYLTAKLQAPLTKFI